MASWLIITLAVIGVIALALLVDAADAPPASRCKHCGKKLDKDHIPQDIRDSARQAGFGTSPLWYVGPLVCPHYKPETGLGEIVRQAREDAGLPPSALGEKERL